MAVKPLKKLIYQPNKPPLYISENTMNSIREDIPDMSLPTNFLFTKPLKKLSFFQNNFQFLEVESNSSVLDEALTSTRESSSQKNSSLSPDSNNHEFVYSLVNWQY